MQRKLIEEWLQTPPNRELFFGWLMQWEEAYPQSMPDAAKAWEVLNAQLEPLLPTSAEPESAGPLPASRWPGIPVRWAAAASVVLLLGLGFAFRDTLRYVRYTTASGQVTTIPLPDGSRAVLNANSELSVPRFGFGTADRLVLLKGEADFTVMGQPSRQRFVVRTPTQVDVVVLGTEFAVVARHRLFRVALHSGKIKLQHTPATGLLSAALTLMPGDVVTLNPTGHFNLNRQQPTRQLVAWKSHQFIFDRSSLREVVTILNEHFGEDIRLDDQVLATHQITGRFNAERSGELLDAVTQLTGCRLVVNGNQKILTK